MHKKTTLFYLVNDLEKLTEEYDDCDVEMDDSDIYNKLEMTEFQNPSDQTVQAILDFAQSYSCIKSRTLDEIDLYLN
ncbi:MAG: hypothetical protein HN352_12820 [Bacteroidetes bacterium]|jgi:hypothetical protein|nr:hypothetical protein [Bacteroidota bacterium]MBT4402108.1 hypothetical protein [Bacteroidota bacterium]MBT4408940.1 hypothetical protein [Bacteroidota bacterium]MBT7465120.1 hypothetical protein [Bacteroidota bacterium]